MNLSLKIKPALSGSTESRTGLNVKGRTLKSLYENERTGVVWMRSDQAISICPEAFSDLRDVPGFLGEVYDDTLALRLERFGLDPGHLEHAARGATGVGVVVFVGQVHDAPDAALDQNLGALVTGKQGDIGRRTGQVGAVLVHDGVEFGVTDIGVLGVERRLGLARPGQFVVAAPDGEAVVPDAEDLVPGRDDARAHLRIGVLAAVRRQDRNPHEIIAPRNVTFALGGHALFSLYFLLKRFP